MKKRSAAVFWLALQRVFQNVPLVANQLLAVYGSPPEIFRAAKSIKADKGPITALKNFDDWGKCEEDFRRCDKEGIRIIAMDDPLYPANLNEIAAKPILLMVRGDSLLLSGPCISIVGARKATSHGKEIAFEIARDLAEMGFVVVSGMAYGIDAASHLGAIETGKTVAVWGSGIDCCYPTSFRDLSRRIAESGCILSEFPLGTYPFKQNFPQRNRIISGLSSGTIVVEAASKSGSLITARFALEQGREVFAVPGPAGGAMSSGTNDLLRQGAAFVENARDVIAAVAPQLTFISNDNKGRKP